MESHTFDAVLDLEEQFYAAGFQQGLNDGSKAGKIEGRTFGLEKGFEKYMESGRLYGKSIVWTNQISGPQAIPTVLATQAIPNTSTVTNVSAQTTFSTTLLPPLPVNFRLKKHIRMLHALSESESLSVENTEEAVTDFDDRMQRAQGKEKVILRLVQTSKDELIRNGI